MVCGHHSRDDLRAHGTFYRLSIGKKGVCEKMTCKNGKCDFDSKLHRPVKISKIQKRYAELWRELELPKLLKEREK
jgi:hypothetical protein